MICDEELVLDSEDDEILLEKQNVFLYSIPFNINQKPGNFHKASDWDLSNPDGTCKLSVAAAGPSCHIQLEDDDGNVFGQSVVEVFPGGFGNPSCLNAVVDSSRYFTLKMQKLSGEYDFIGLGFSSHADSSDLAKTLENYFTMQSKSRETSSKHPSILIKGEGASISELKVPECVVKMEEIINEPEEIVVRLPTLQNTTTTADLTVTDREKKVNPVTSEILVNEPAVVSTTSEAQTQPTAANNGPLETKRTNGVKRVRKNRGARKQMRRVTDPFGGYRYCNSNNLLLCHLCRETFKCPNGGSDNPLIEHWTSCHKMFNVKSLTCSMCALLYSNDSQLLQHKYLLHKHNCSLCTDKFMSESGLQEHSLHVHKKTLQYTCDKCSSIFYTREGFRTHVKTGCSRPSQPGESQLVTDNQSTVEFSIEVLQGSHSRRLPASDLPEIHAVSKPKRVRRTLGQMAKDLDKIVDPLGGHRYRKPNKLFVCHLCDQTFTSARAVFRHWTLVHKIITQSLICRQCFLLYSDHAQMRLHNDLIHANSPP